jgi:hypothetical protein
MRALRPQLASLSPEARRKIGESLRATYGEVLDQAIPIRHLALLQRFEADEARAMAAQTVSGRPR